VASSLSKDVTFRFIGDGNLRAELERELASEIKSGSVEFTGWVDHDSIPDQLSELRLLVLPSEPTEGLPTVILESMACGTPVLATPVSGVPDVVQNKKTGYWIEQVTHDWIVQSINEILQSDEAITISRSGHQLINEKYNFDSAVDRYKRILQSV